MAFDHSRIKGRAADLVIEKLWQHMLSQFLFELVVGTPLG